MPIWSTAHVTEFSCLECMFAARVPISPHLNVAHERVLNGKNSPGEFLPVKLVREREKNFTLY